MSIELGCIADDFTGGTDVAAALRRAGMSVTLLFDPPTAQTAGPRTDAVVIALKTRTVAPEEAVRDTVASQAWLQENGCRRTYFKYCSTFDSTAEGNIGPVADALSDSLGYSATDGLADGPVLICPASPEHGRTTYQGHHFVHDVLLSESSMRHHPLTPMTDPDLRRVLSAQTQRSVGSLPLSEVRAGVEAVTGHLSRLHRAGTRYAVVDATEGDDLLTVAEAAREARLVTGGAGLAGALARIVTGGAAGADVGAPTVPRGRTLVLAGSCSAATLEQVARAAAVMPAHRLDPVLTPDPSVMLERASRWLDDHDQDESVVIYSSAGPEDRTAGLAAMGPETATHLETVLGALAARSAAAGTPRVVVAGGETSGAVVQSLGLDCLEVAHEADHGVPWCVAPDGRLAVLLKSGNFGQPDLLVRAVKDSA